MKFVIIAALVAAASAADYHDDVFHFSNLEQLSGLQKSSAKIAQPVYAQQYAAEVAQPYYAEKYAQPAVFAQQYAVKQLAQPVVFAQQPAVFTQQYAVKQLAQPAVFAQQYAVKQLAQPAVFTQQYAVKQLAQPAVFAQQYAVKQLAQPAVITQKYAVKQLAQPAVIPQQFALKQLAQPVIAEQYAVKPLVSQQPSALAGVSTYASAYQGPQYSILSQVQETDAAGPYKLSYSTENGIQHSEEGYLTEGSEGPVVAKQGSYSYTAPDGQVYAYNYIADENGFRAVDASSASQSGEQYNVEARLFKN